MLKKLTALLLSVGVLFSMSGCGGSKVSDDALDALETAIQNAVDMKSADIEMKIDATASDQNVVLGLKGSYNVETSNPELAFTLDMSSQGQKVDNFVTIYLNKDAVYTNMMDIQKQKISIKEAMSSMPAVSLDKETMKIPKEDLKKNLKEASLKGDTLTLVFDTEKINEEVKKAADSSSLTAASTQNATVKELKMTSKLENKQLRNADIDLTMTQTKDGKTEDVKMKMSLSFKNVGKNQKITFPTDLNTYVETKQ